MNEIIGPRVFEVAPNQELINDATTIVKHGSQSEAEEVRVELVELPRTKVQYEREVIVKDVARFMLNDDTYDLIYEAC